jgi:transcription elongation GreA/GreB family factor
MLSKTSLKEHCITLINNRIDGIVRGMAAAQLAANEETKSSVGDKYETARAMNQLEKDMLARQLAENKKELAAMLEVDVTGEYDEVKTGSLIRTNEMYFFILGGLGKMTVEDATVFVISPNAPLARSIMGKKAGEEMQFNTQTMEILELC